MHFLDVVVVVVAVVASVLDVGLDACVWSVLVSVTFSFVTQPGQQDRAGQQQKDGERSYAWVKYWA